MQIERFLEHEPILTRANSPDVPDSGMIGAILREFHTSTTGEEQTKMRSYTKYYLAGLAALALTVPAWAHTFKEPLDIEKATTIGTMQLAPGSYELSADSTKKDLDVTQKNKVIATIPGQWIKMPQKAEAPEVITDNGKITEVQFGGSDQAFQVQ